MAKESIKSLKLQLEQLQMDRNQQAALAQQATKVANDLNIKLTAIDQLLSNSPFIQKGWFKKVWWVISNWKEIVALIESIILQIEDWREYIKQLMAKGQATTTPSAS